MSESLVTPRFDLSNLEVLNVYESPRNGYVAEHGLIHTDNGDLSIFVTPQAPNVRRLEIEGFACHDFGELMNLRSNIRIRVASGYFGADFMRTLGYDYFLEEQEEESKIVSVAPTADYLNSALQTLYDGSLQTPPVTFIDKTTNHGHATGKEFIESLAEGKVLISAPIQGDIYEFTHDLKYHVPGYGYLDNRTFLGIKKRAEQLVKLGKLSTNINGDLAEDEAKVFAVGVEALTPFVNHDLSLDREDSIETLRERLTDSTLRVRPEFLRAIRIERIRKGLIEHQGWLERRSQELQIAA